MTEEQLDILVQQMGAQRAEHTVATLRELMPTLLHSRQGARTAAFLTALERAAQRSKQTKRTQGAE